MFPIKRTQVKVTIKRTGHKPAMIHLPTAEAYMDAIKERAALATKEHQRQKMHSRGVIARAFDHAGARSRKS